MQNATSLPPDIPSPLIPTLAIISSTFVRLQESFHRVPGSQILLRYIKSSYQNDPYRSLLELFLVAFAVRTILMGRTRGEGDSKNWVKLTDQEIDDLVDDFTPLPLVAPISPLEATILPSLPVIQGQASHKPKLNSTGKQVFNFAGPNWAGLLGNEQIKDLAVDTLRKYGVGTCGPPGFYGTMDVHNQLEHDLSTFLQTESAIIYSQSFSTISSVIPAFAKRGDVIVADKLCNFAIQKGLQIARCTVKWYEHNDLMDLERVLKGVERDFKRKGRKGVLGRRFIVTEGLFENDGEMLDLAKVVELKKRYKFRLILDESYSFGMIGKTGRGMTEYCNVPASEVDMLIGSMATGLCSGGGFCAGSEVVIDHQRINGSAFVFSAALPALLATTASAGIAILSSNPSIMPALQENVKTLRLALQKLESVSIYIPSDPSSALIHIFMLSPPETVELEEKLLQDVVDDALSQGVMLTRARRLRGQETFEPAPSLKIMVSAAFTKKEIEKAGAIIKGSLIKCLGKKR